MKASTFAGALKAFIIRQGEDIIGQGAEDATVAEICRKAGVSYPSFD